jgi:hypothetical protein
LETKKFSPKQVNMSWSEKIPAPISRLELQTSGVFFNEGRKTKGRVLSPPL